MSRSVALSQSEEGMSPKAGPPERYLALDAARGFVMVVLCTGGLGLGLLDGSPTLQRVAAQFRHLRWDGFVPWELIMPAFMFMVGTSLPFALARRREQGQTCSQMFRHAGCRVLALIVLGQVLWSLYAGRYHFDPIETLTQLGLSYWVAFLVLQLEFRWQIVAAAFLTALNWALFVIFPGPGGSFSPTANVGLRIDRAVFGLDHTYDWSSINFIGSTVTVLFGAWTGSLLKDKTKLPSDKVKILTAAVVTSFVLTFVLLPVNPIIHKCWTASFTVCHTGFVLLMILLFFWLFDVKRYHKLAYPFVVVGMNSIFIYLINQSLKSPWLDQSVGVFTQRFKFLGVLGPVAQAWAVFFVMWYICYWLYQRKIFFKV